MTSLLDTPNPGIYIFATATAVGRLREKPLKKTGTLMLRRAVLTGLFLTCALLAGRVEKVDAQVRRAIFSAGAEKLFKQGLADYELERYRKAQESFQRLLEFPLNQRSSAGQLMLGKTLFKIEEYEAALQTVRGLQKKFDRSRYLSDAGLLAGDCYYVLRRYYEAAAQYGRILAISAPLDLQGRAAERLAAIVKNGSINPEAVDRIRASVGGNRFREALLFGEARWYQRLGWEAQSRVAMQVYIDSMPDGIFAGMARRSMEVAGGEVAIVDSEIIPERERSSLDGTRPAGWNLGEAGQRPRLGFLLPMSGPQRQIGEDLYAGAQLANEQLGEPFELVVADIGFEYGEVPIAEDPSSELLRVVHQTRYLIEEEQVLAIVGPLFSSDCVPAAVVAESYGIPLIAPLAQQSGLDSLGQYIFQLYTIPEVQGRALGEYATLVLGMQNLVILTPLSDYGWNFEREFTRAAHANGGDVVYADWYVPEETKDFRRVFEEVRKVGFKLMPPPPEDSLAMVDSLMWTVPDSTPEEEEPSFLRELLAGLDEEESSEEEEEEEEAPPDSSEIFINSIDGVVIVVESFEDARTIAPQLHFHRLETQILGNEFWYEPEAIRQMRSGDRGYIEGTIFVAGYREEDPVARSFTDAFRRRFARDPGYAALGHDAALLVMSGWEQGRQDSGALRDWLEEVHGFEGASGRISFTSGRRSNSELILLKIDQRGLVRPLSSEDLPDLSLPEEDLPEAELDLPEAEFLPEEDLEIEE